jgi:hypothetical protein
MAKNISQQEESESNRKAADSDHLDGVSDGCGCTEIWEHLSEERATVEEEE